MLRFNKIILSSLLFGLFSIIYGIFFIDTKYSLSINVLLFKDFRYCILLTIFLFAMMIDECDKYLILSRVSKYKEYKHIIIKEKIKEYSLLFISYILVTSIYYLIFDEYFNLLNYVYRYLVLFLYINISNYFVLSLGILKYKRNIATIGIIWCIFMVMISLDISFMNPFKLLYKIDILLIIRMILIISICIMVMDCYNETKRFKIKCLR